MCYPMNFRPFTYSGLLRVHLKLKIYVNQIVASKQKYWKSCWVSITWLMIRCDTGDCGCGCIFRDFLWCVCVIACDVTIDTCCLPGTPVWYDVRPAISCEHWTRNHWNHSTAAKLAKRVTLPSNNGDYCKVSTLHRDIFERLICRLTIFI